MINLSELIAAIREVAKENPDFVYQGKCQYTPSKENPLGCIVGAGLTKLGFDCSTLVQYKTFRLLVDEGSLIVNGDNNEVKWIDLVQSLQDGWLDASWSECISKADSGEST